jgi:hypothetical protein
MMVAPFLFKDGPLATPNGSLCWLFTARGSQPGMCKESALKTLEPIVNFNLNLITQQFAE